MAAVSQKKKNQSETKTAPSSAPRNPPPNAQVKNSLPAASLVIAVTPKNMNRPVVSITLACGAVAMASSKLGPAKLVKPARMIPQRNGILANKFDMQL